MAMTGVNKAGVGIGILGAVALGIGLADLRFKMISKAAMIALTSAGGAAALIGVGMATTRTTTKPSGLFQNRTATTVRTFGIPWLVVQTKNQEVHETPAYVTDLFAFAQQHQGEKVEVAADALLETYADKGGKEKLLEDLNSDAFTQFALRKTNVFTDSRAALLQQVQGYLESQDVKFD